MVRPRRPRPASTAERVPDDVVLRDPDRAGAWAASPWWPPARALRMAEVYDDRPDASVPATGPLAGADLRRVRFSLAFRGYRMSEVDALLDRLATRAGGAAGDAEPPTKLNDAVDAGGSWRRTDRLGHTSQRVARGDRLHPDRAGGGRGGADPPPAGRDSGAAGQHPGRPRAGQRAHGAGVLALVVWVLFLVADDETTLGGSAVGHRRPGLLVGRRRRRPADPGPLAAEPRQARLRAASEDSWSEGPGLSILAHVGMLVGVCVFTCAYLTSAV